MKFTHWAVEQVKTREASTEMVQPKVQALVDALSALRGKPGGQVFGMGAERIEPEGRAELEASIVSALGGWKRHFESARDAVSLLALDEVGRAHGLAALRTAERFPLRCDPLGTRDGLSAEWRDRLARLDEAKAGERMLNPEAIEFALDLEGAAPEVEFGAPEPDALYQFALRYEAEQDAPFPRELAAFWATANGILVEEDPVLRPISQWEWDFEGRGICIGCGSYVQGSLILLKPTRKRGLLASKVLDVDDDGVKLAEYPGFAAFADALLGT